MTAKRRLGTTGYYVVSILIAVVAMIPFLWMISTSLKSRGALMSIPIEWIPAEPSLDAYGEVFSRFPFLKTIGNSLFISVSYTVITLISASMAAFAFAKIRFRCANLLLKLYLATMMIPTQVTMIPLFVIMNRLGLIDSYEAEHAEQANVAVNTDHEGYYGEGFVDQFASEGCAVTFTVNSDGDTALLDVRYSAGTEAAQRTLLVNGESIVLDLPKTQDWDSWNTVSVPVELVSGQNTITISYQAGNFAGINLDCISLRNQ